MLVTLDGISTLERLVQLLNAYFPIFVIPLFISINLICSRLEYHGAELDEKSFMSPVPSIVSTPSEFSVHVRSSTFLPHVPLAITSAALAVVLKISIIATTAAAVNMIIKIFHAFFIFSPYVFLFYQYISTSQLERYWNRRIISLLLTFPSPLISSVIP